MGGRLIFQLHCREIHTVYPIEELSHLLCLRIYNGQIDNYCTYAIYVDTTSLNIPSLVDGGWRGNYIPTRYSMLFQSMTRRSRHSLWIEPPDFRNPRSIKLHISPVRCRSRRCSDFGFWYCLLRWRIPRSAIRKHTGAYGVPFPSP